jgi:predicted double-glycine peptidase
MNYPIIFQEHTMKKILFGFLWLIITAFPLYGQEVLRDNNNSCNPTPYNGQCENFKEKRDENGLPKGYKPIAIVRGTQSAHLGAASLAMLINSFTGSAWNEQKVNQGLWEHCDKDKVKERGRYSLLDMKKYLAAIGYDSAGYKAVIINLRELDRPAIVPIQWEGCKYVPVLEGIDEDYVYLADPCLGYRRFTVSEFEEVWSSVCFLIEGKTAADQSGEIK